MCTSSGESDLYTGIIRDTTQRWVRQNIEAPAQTAEGRNITRRRVRENGNVRTQRERERESEQTQRWVRTQ
jgi:hypothetical protein